jgi:hypothetical protein
VAASFALAGPASAAILIQAGNVPGNLETVHLDGLDTGSDNIVNGTVAGPGGDVGVIIQGLELITVSANGGGQGQAWVVAKDGGLQFLDFRLASGFTFGAIEFDLNAPDSKGKPVKWDVTIEGFGSNGEFKSQLLEDLTNNSFVNAWGTGITQLTHVSFTTADVDLIGVGHIRVGDVTAAVPEPATWAMMLLGFGGMGAMLRSRRKALATA